MCMYSSRRFRLPTEKAIQLISQQSGPCQNQTNINGFVKDRIMLRLLDFFQHKNDGNERKDLPHLYADIEAQDFCQKLIGTKVKRLQTGRQTETMYQPESKNHEQQVRCRCLKDPLKTVEVFKALIRYA